MHHQHIDWLAIAPVMIGRGGGNHLHGRFLDDPDANTSRSAAIFTPLSQRF